jgi:hypothetical protein
MLHAQFGIATVEVFHLAITDMGGADRQPWRAAIDQIEIDEFVQRLLKRLGRVISGPVGAKWIIDAGVGQRVRLEEPGMPFETVDQ